MKRIITAIAVLFNTLVQVEPTIAQMIQWKAVPETDSPSLVNPNSASASIGINTWERRDEQIAFDADIDGEYVRYNGNCQTKMLYRLNIGGLNEQRQPLNVQSYPNDTWFRANEFQDRILTMACSLR
jgi:hypothetical protein